MGFIGSIQGSSGRLAAQLGEALGMGLGEFTGSYFANSALNDVVKDPKLKNANSEERFEALKTKLAPYGARGERMFAKQLELDQKVQDREISKLENKFLRGEKLTDQEENAISPKTRIEKMKIDKPKASSTALNNQPVPPEIAQAMGEIAESMPNSSPIQLETAFAKAGIPPTYYKGFVESQRRINEKSQDRQAKKDDKVIDELASAPGKAVARGSFNTLVNAALSGEQDPGSSADIARITGIKAFETPGAAAAATASKEFLINSLDQIRGRPNQFLEQQVTKSLSETGLPRSANAAKLRVIKFALDSTDKYEQIVSDLEESGDYPPGKLKNVAQKEFREWEDAQQHSLIKDLKDITGGNYRSLDEGKYIEDRRSKLQGFPGYILVEFDDGKIDGWKESDPLPPGAKKV